MKLQTVISLSNLQTALSGPMSAVPNQVGFRILGILKLNSLAIPLSVSKDDKGCHYLVDQFNSHQPSSLFSGWIKDGAR